MYEKYPRSRDRSIDRHHDRRNNSEKQYRNDRYRSKSRDRHYHHHSSSSSRSSSSNGHRDKRRSYGDERNSSSRYDRSDSRSRHKSRDRWPYNRRSSRDRDSKSNSSRKDTGSSYNRYNQQISNHISPNGTKKDLLNNSSATSHQYDHQSTAPTSYYQHQYHQSQQMDQQQQSVSIAAWSVYYGWSVSDFNSAYKTNYTQEQYDQFIQQYYQPQDTNGYYAYYDAYYQQQQQEIPQHHNTNTVALHMDGVSEDMLDKVGYPIRLLEDPSLLFEKIGQVGEGTYGKVYKARNTITGKLMALKRIRMRAEKEGFPITAMREIKLLQKLKHERIVELQEIMIAKGSIYMVLEYMDHDLSGILGHPNFKFEPAHAKSIVKQMLEGIAYLHQMGILHRDIKGSNLLINNKGELKIADFGLARVFEKNKAHDYSNRVITIWYRPPELLLGATAYGPSVDIWSVGCIMLELFTGKAVFNGTDEVSQLDCIYKIMGTPTEESWPSITELPWFELVRPKANYVSKFKEYYASLLSPDTMELAKVLLSMDPTKRPTAAEALEFDYFKELPEPILPANLLGINGDWHEFESKQRKKQQKAAATTSNK